MSVDPEFTAQVEASTVRQWRELGFWYDVTEEPPCWTLRGSVKGLRGLGRELRKFADKTAVEPTWDHEHLGPFSYLEIGIQRAPKITLHWVQGTEAELRQLADAIDQRLDAAVPGDAIWLDDFYGCDNTARMQVLVEPEGFDPAGVPGALGKWR